MAAMCYITLYHLRCISNWRVVKMFLTFREKMIRSLQWCIFTW